MTGNGSVPADQVPPWYTGKPVVLVVSQVVVKIGAGGFTSEYAVIRPEPFPSIVP